MRRPSEIKQAIVVLGVISIVIHEWLNIDVLPKGFGPSWYYYFLIWLPGFIYLSCDQAVSVVAFIRSQEPCPSNIEILKKFLLLMLSSVVLAVLYSWVLVAWVLIKELID